MAKVTHFRQRPPAQIKERIFAGGINFTDYFELQKRCEENHEDWPSVCEEIGDRNFDFAQQQMELGHNFTARDFFLAGQVLYRVGQYGLNEWNEEKIRFNRKIVSSVSKAALLFETPWEGVKIPYKDYDMDGWLMKPSNMKEGTPIVIVIPGATGFKEEYIPQARKLVERGLAVLLIDGPGQGTTLLFNKGYLEIEIENAYSVMIDWIKDYGSFGKVGITGGSTGGYYVPRVAATDDRIDACAINGGTYTPEEILDFAPIYKHKFALLFGVTDDEMDKIFPKMTLKGLADKITCPLLVMNGAKDTIFKPQGSERIFNEASSKDKTLKLYPNGWHCSLGHDNECNNFIADWMADRLANTNEGDAGGK